MKRNLVFYLVVGIAVGIVSSLVIRAQGAGFSNQAQIVVTSSTISVNIPSPLSVPGVATSTITGDGTTSTISSTLVVSSISSNQPTSPSSIYNIQTGNVTFGSLGTPTVFTTTSVVGSTTFCQALALIIVNSTSSVTSTLSLPNLPSIQSSTPQTGGCGPLVPGAKQLQEVYNSSTANLIINASTGIVFKLNGVTSTWPAGQTSSTVIVPPLGMMEQDGTDITASLFIIENTLFQ